jgi:bacteriorhodopsin
MDNRLDKFVVYTTVLSIAVQLATGIYGVYGLTKSVPVEHQALKTSLTIEMVVQLIEFIFYVWVIFHLHVPTMAATRYRDWIFTTPLMLFSLMLYFMYEEYREGGVDTTTVWQDFTKEHRAAIATVLVSNILMIIFGYLGEVGTISKINATILGFVFFGIAFYVMYDHFASKSAVGTRLFSIIGPVWGLYGVVYLFPTPFAAHKNIALNGLDVVAKNLFGTYLAYKVVTLSRHTID